MLPSRFKRRKINGEDYEIETVGYYKRDNDMNVTVGETSLPKLLNRNHQKFQKLQTSKGLVPKDQCINLAESKVIDDGNVEHYFESLLNYISEKGFGGETPQFVTNRQLLAEIATKPSYDPVLVVRYGGVIFISLEKYEKKCAKKKEREDESSSSDEKNIQSLEEKNAIKYIHGAHYAHYLTRESDDEKIPEDYAKSYCKAVMKCKVMLNEERLCVLYSAETDAREEDTKQNVELKTIAYGTDNYHFWNLDSCPYYWKLFFGGCQIMLVGDKTGAETEPIEGNTEEVRVKATGEVKPKDPLRDEYPEHSLCRIEKLEIGKIFPEYEMRYKEFEKRIKAWEKRYKEWELCHKEWEQRKEELEWEQARKKSEGLETDPEEFEKEPEKPTKEKGEEEKWPKWSVESGQNRVRRLLRDTKRKCSDEGVCYFGTEDRENKTWRFEKVGRRHPEYKDAQEFMKMVNQKMDIWKTNFPKKCSV